MNYNYPQAGALYHTGDTCTFTVWSPLSQSVSLIINNTSLALTPDERGYWQITLPDIRPGITYQYLQDDGYPLPDPASRWQPEGVHGASAVADPSFTWTDDAWKGLPLEELVIYELHTGTFTAAGNFAGVITKLDYLQQLGINAIELMPITAFPGQRNWGYDGVYPFAVHTAYGGIQGLKELVDAAHARGMAVILDVVYNHLGPEGNYFPAYGPYFTDKYQSVWGKAMNFDDAHSDGVRHFFWQNALMWLDEFHIDGLRLDAVHAIRDSGADHFIATLERKVRILEQESGRRKLLIAEFDLNDPRYIAPVEKGGYGLDGQWMDEFHHALHSLVTGERDGYYEDFGDAEHLAKALRDSYVYTGQYSVHRKKHFGVLPDQHAYGQFVVFAQNHDQIGNRLAGDRLSTQLSFEGLKLVAATVLLSPHVPLLFMGEEYGETNPFQYFVSHTDEELINRVRKGRREEFAYFNWQGEIPDPAAENTFEQCKLSWAPGAQGNTLFSFYQYLNAFRTSRPAMRCRERKHLQILATADAGIVGFERLYEQDHLLIFLNFNKVKTICHYPLPLSAKKLFDSSDERWQGPGVATYAIAEEWIMNPESVVVYEILIA